jgi:hypothetical protein
VARDGGHDQVRGQLQILGRPAVQCPQPRQVHDQLPGEKLHFDRDGAAQGRGSTVSFANQEAVQGISSGDLGEDEPYRLGQGGGARR